MMEKKLRYMTCIQTEIEVIALSSVASERLACRPPSIDGIFSTAFLLLDAYEIRASITSAKLDGNHAVQRDD